MSKNNYYEDVKIIKKPLKKRLKKIFNFFIIILVFSCTIIASIYLSKAISVGGISSLIVYGNTEIKIQSHELYAVVLGEYETQEEAEKVSIGSNIQGASGYVWKDNNYMVIGNIYASIDDAEKIIQNLADSNYKAYIYTIKFPKIHLSLSEYVGEDVNFIEKSIKYIDKLCKELYTYSIAYDKGESNNFAISSKISELRGECKTYISKLQSVLSIQSPKVEKIQHTIILIDEILNDAVLKTIDNSTTSYIIKNIHSKIIHLKYGLFNDL